MASDIRLLAFERKGLQPGQFAIRTDGRPDIRIGEQSPAMRWNRALARARHPDLSGLATLALVRHAQGPVTANGGRVQLLELTESERTRDLALAETLRLMTERERVRAGLEDAAFACQGQRLEVRLCLTGSDGHMLLRQRRDGKLGLGVDVPLWAADRHLGERLFERTCSRVMTRLGVPAGIAARAAVRAVKALAYDYEACRFVAIAFCDLGRLVSDDLPAAKLAGRLSALGIHSLNERGRCSGAAPPALSDALSRFSYELTAAFASFQRAPAKPD
ncbi:hypothetical protein CKO28_09065 [Rhodovibrio sodomensis]|uniref:Uncharacterized protein n=1 Tax=Rhodovibrio sodomensis TaxID=1088 RepID=A0ABS1DDZ6_9PROT|nr:hypothetical protein [Rhodovibrio sodomensis]MBK1668186.1 hypothetical protein [Rhodovibrio sodomensis]